MTSSAREPLPRLRRKRRFNLPRIVGRFSDGVASVEAQVEDYASRWDEANAVARYGDGPLWVALGDSSTQGVGASTWENSWVHAMLNLLRSHTGEPWRVINLAMSGGRFLDVADRQIPVLNTMLDEPQLVTCVIGSNDLLWRRGADGIVRDARRAVSRIPHRSFVSQLNGPGQRPDLLNAEFDKGAAARDHQLFNIWNWPSGRGALAADRIHPSDIGYDHMTELAWNAVRPQLDS